MFLGTRGSLAENLQVSSITVYGFQRESVLDVSYLLMLVVYFTVVTAAQLKLIGKLKLCNDKKAVLSQGNRAMLQLFFSV